MEDAVADLVGAQPCVRAGQVKECALARGIDADDAGRGRKRGIPADARRVDATLLEQTEQEIAERICPHLADDRRVQTEAPKRAGGVQCAAASPQRDQVDGGKCPHLRQPVDRAGDDLPPPGSRGR